MVCFTEVADGHIADDGCRVLWRVELTVTDLSNDLRKYLPLLAAVGIDQIGIDSGGAVTVYMRETDKTVILLKQQSQ